MVVCKDLDGPRHAGEVELRYDDWERARLRVRGAQHWAQAAEAERGERRSCGVKGMINNKCYSDSSCRRFMKISLRKE
jgi:hypothetical protein